MKNLYFLCLAKQNFKLTVLSKGYILQFSFDPLFIKLLFKILKMKRNRQPSNLIIFISSYSHITLHPSYILISSVIVCTRASFFSDEAPQWWWCHTRSRAVPDTVYPQLDQNSFVWCLGRGEPSHCQEESLFNPPVEKKVGLFSSRINIAIKLTYVGGLSLHLHASVKEEANCQPFWK